MTKFEQVGINYQYDATNIHEANKSFEHSCDRCCANGVWLECDRCAIAHTHNMIVAYFNNKTKEMTS